MTSYKTRDNLGPDNTGPQGSSLSNYSEVNGKPLRVSEFHYVLTASLWGLYGEQTVEGQGQKQEERQEATARV